MRVVGVDGCRAGWVAAVLDTGSNRLAFQVFRRVDALFRAFEDAACIAIDIPIGLTDGPRECDVLARKFIGSRAPSVFPAPCRAVLSAPTYAFARAASLRATGKSLSAQTFAIVPKIREVDELMTPALQARVHEVHPEVCFAGLTGKPMDFPKRDSSGFEERRAALLRALPGIELPARGLAARFVAGAGADDLLDATVAAWSAARAAAGTALTLPADPPRDATGLRMEMVY